jgi:hypothetical protein
MVVVDSGRWSWSFRRYGAVRRRETIVARSSSPIMCLTLLVPELTLT